MMQRMYACLMLLALEHLSINFCRGSAMRLFATLCTLALCASVRPAETGKTDDSLPTQGDEQRSFAFNSPHVKSPVSCLDAWLAPLRVPGHPADFKPILATNVSDELMNSFNAAVQHSMIDVPVEGAEAIMKEQLLANPSQLIQNSLKLNGRFEFFEFLATKCNKNFVNALISVLNEDLRDDLLIVAALYNDPIVVDYRFPTFASNVMFECVRAKNFVFINLMHKFIDVHAALYEAASRKDFDMKSYFAGTSLEDKISFYANCALLSLQIPKRIYKALPVTSNVFLDLVAQPKFESTLMRRVIVEHLVDEDMPEIEAAAVQFFEARNYKSYINTVLWLPKDMPLRIPDSKEDPTKFLEALKSFNAKYLPVKKASRVAEAYGKLGQRNPLYFFLKKYLESEVLEDEAEEAVTLIWLHKQELFFIKNSIFPKKSMEQYVALVLASATRAGLTRQDPRVVAYLRTINHLTDFDICMLDYELDKLNEGPVTIPPLRVPRDSTQGV